MYQHKSTNFKPLKFIAKETKKHSLCACKASKNAPFCDGSHRSDAKVLQAYNTSLLKSNSTFREDLAVAEAQNKALKCAIAGLFFTIVVLQFKR